MSKALDCRIERIKGVIFDLDGTLVDSKLNFDAMRRELGITDGSAILEYIATLESKAEKYNAEEIISHHEMDGARNATWMPGAENFVRLLQQQNIPMAILTRNMRRATELTVGLLNIPISRIITREDCLPKPDPEGLLLVTEEWGLKRKELVYIGDHLFDLQTASRASMIACLYRNDGNQQYADQADWVIDHFDELSSAFLKRKV